MNNIRIGIAGITNHGNTILNAILAAGNLELVSCFDIKADACREAAERFGLRVAESYDDLVSDPELDAVALVTPNHLHHEETLLAARYGKHVFVDKPISRTTDEARDMIRAMNEAKLTLLVGHNTRRKRVFRKLKEIIDAGELGDIVAVEANLSRSVGLDNDLPHWKSDSASCPLLPMTQLGIHFVDTVHYLFSECTRVACSAGSIAMSGAHDATAALLWTREKFPITITSHYTTTETYFFRVYGTKGMIECRPYMMTRFNLMGAVTEQTDFSEEGAESYMLQMREFGDCIRSGSELETGGAVGLKALAVLEAMYESAETGNTVAVKCEK